MTIGLVEVGETRAEYPFWQAVVELQKRVEEFQIKLQELCPDSYLEARIAKLGEQLVALENALHNQHCQGIEDRLSELWVEYKSINVLRERRCVINGINE